MRIESVNIPTVVLISGKVTMGAAVTYALLLQLFADEAGMVQEASIEAVADVFSAIAGTKPVPQTIRRHCRELEDAGFLKYSKLRPQTGFRCQCLLKDAAGGVALPAGFERRHSGTPEKLVAQLKALRARAGYRTHEPAFDGLELYGDVRKAVAPIAEHLDAEKVSGVFGWYLENADPAFYGDRKLLPFFNNFHHFEAKAGGKSVADLSAARIISAKNGKDEMQDIDIFKNQLEAVIAYVKTAYASAGKRLPESEAELDTLVLNWHRSIAASDVQFEELKQLFEFCQTRRFGNDAEKMLVTPSHMANRYAAFKALNAAKRPAPAAEPTPTPDTGKRDIRDARLSLDAKLWVESARQSIEIEPVDAKPPTCEHGLASFRRPFNTAPDAGDCAICVAVREGMRLPDEYAAIVAKVAGAGQAESAEPDDDEAPGGEPVATTDGEELRVFAINDCDFWADVSLEAAIANATKYQSDTLGLDGDDLAERWAVRDIGDKLMDELIFQNDGEDRSLREELRRRRNEYKGEGFFFASTEF